MDNININIHGTINNRTVSFGYFFFFLQSSILCLVAVKIQDRNFRILPLLDLLAKFKRLLACSCSPNFCVARKLVKQIFYFCSCSQKIAVLGMLANARKDHSSPLEETSRRKRVFHFNDQIGKYDPCIYHSVEPVLATTARENVAFSGKDPVGANLHFFRFFAV